MGIGELLGQPVQMLGVACNGKVSPLGKRAMHLPARSKLSGPRFIMGVTRLKIYFSPNSVK